MRRFSVLLLGCLLLAGCGGGGGGSDDAASNATKYPHVYSISPASGNRAGGLQVTVTGDNFTKRSNNDSVVVDIGGTTVPSTVTNDTTLTFTTPSGDTFFSPGLNQAQVKVRVSADNKLSTELTGSNDPLFTYTR